MLTQDAGDQSMLALNDRQTDIVTLARSVGRVSVDDLAARFDVSPQTIRKDLNDLCEKRILTRVHGGAIIASSVENVSYDARRFIASDEKRAIGIAAAALIPNKSSLFINIGTTTEEVAAALHAHEDLLVITNNLNVATGLCRHPRIDVIVVGGPVRSDGAVIGSVAVDLIHKFKVDTAVIGASAIDEDGSLLDFDYEEVKVAQAIIANARRVILVADRLKFERAAPIRIASLSAVDAFVTDRLPNEEMRAICAASGVDVVETSPFTAEADEGT
jgi:DeoR family glycerol-3-phosphate regulon repressor